MKKANKIINILMIIHMIIYIFLKLPISSRSILGDCFYFLQNFYICIIYGLCILIIIKFYFYYDMMKNKKDYEEKDKKSWWS